MSKYANNNTYKDLKSLLRLFIASIFIIGGLNYIFVGIIDNLSKETKNLQIKESIEKKISQNILSARDDFSQIILSNDDKSFKYLQNNINSQLKQIKEYLNVLKLGGSIKIDQDLYQKLEYRLKKYSDQYDKYNLLSLNKTEDDLKKLQTILSKYFQISKDNTSIIDNKNQIQSILTIFDEIKRNHTALLKQTIYQIRKLDSDILIKKDKYVGIELLAIIFVIGSLLYTTNLISNQILKNSERLEELNKETKEMAEKSKQASIAKSEFLANMSHEIRTPLNAILGFIDLLKDKETDKEKLKYIQTISSSSTTLLSIINDILDFSKIESGNLNIEKIDFNIKENLNTTADLFRAKASQKGISLTFHIDNNLPSAIKSDPTRIKQIIANLLSNAIKFTPQNGRIELIIKEENKTLLVSIKDNGIGIAENKQKTIFKAFSQAENSTTRQYGGTGLGLSISAKLVSMLGGELKLQSVEGEGSRFYFSIPIEIGKYQKQKALQINNINILKGKRILLVEDNKANQMFMTLLFKKFDLLYDIANDGLEAVSAYKDGIYDIILMDENMPNLNGIEATKQILKYENKNNLTHTPIIALTANALKGDRKRFMEAGMDEYLTKPINKDKLALTLSYFLEKQNMKENVC